MKILFVCTGNTCRSPMAEAMLNRLAQDRNINLYSFSRGIMASGSMPASVHAADAAGKICSADLSGHVSKQLNENDINDADLILTMTTQHWNLLVQNYPEAANKTYTLSEYANGRSKNISDPYGADISVYIDCAKELYELIENLIGKLGNTQG